MRTLMSINNTGVRTCGARRSQNNIPLVTCATHLCPSSADHLMMCCSHGRKPSRNGIHGCTLFSNISVLHFGGRLRDMGKSSRRKEQGNPEPCLAPCSRKHYKSTI